jgi:hypothetical protein
VNGYRYVSVQVTEYQDPGTYSQLAVVNVPGATLLSQSVTAVETNTFGYVWVVERTVWKLPNAPASEVVTVTAPLFGALIDQVIVDTLTVDYPCPGNISGVADLGQCCVRRCQADRADARRRGPRARAALPRQRARAPVKASRRRSRCDRRPR